MENQAVYNQKITLLILALIDHGFSLSEIAGISNTNPASINKMREGRASIRTVKKFFRGVSDYLEISESDLIQDPTITVEEHKRIEEQARKRELKSVKFAQERRLDRSDNAKKYGLKLAPVIEELLRQGFTSGYLANVGMVSASTLSKIVVLARRSEKRAEFSLATAQKLLEKLSTFFELNKDELLLDPLSTIKNSETVARRLKEVDQTQVRKTGLTPLNAEQLQKLAKVAEILGCDLDQPLITTLILYMNRPKA